MARYVLLLLLPLLACKAPGPLAADRDPDELFDSSEADLIVVDAILIVDAPLPPVVLRHTVAPGHAYSAATTALEGASVSIHRGDAVFNYRPDPSRAGHYRPPDDAPVVEPGRLYELRVTTGDDVSRCAPRPRRQRAFASTSCGSWRTIWKPNCGDCGCLPRSAMRSIRPRKTS